MNLIQTTDVFNTWFHGIPDALLKRTVQSRIDRAELGNFGDCKSVGEGISEMRIHVGAGYRVYFKQSGKNIYVLLAGGDKSSQAKDIDLALKLARQLEG